MNLTLLQEGIHPEQEEEEEQEASTSEDSPKVSADADCETLSASGVFRLENQRLLELSKLLQQQQQRQRLGVGEDLALRHHWTWDPAQGHGVVLPGMAESMSNSRSPLSLDASLNFDVIDVSTTHLFRHASEITKETKGGYLQGKIKLPDSVASGKRSVYLRLSLVIQSMPNTYYFFTFLQKKKIRFLLKRIRKTIRSIFIPT